MNKNFSIAIFSLVHMILLVPASSKAQNEGSINIKPIDADAFEVMHQFFSYDKGIPLEAHIVESQDKPGYTREKIVFNGIRNNRVPGYLAIPKNGAAPYPCVLLLHGIGDSKEGWWEDNSFISGGQLTKQLLASGFAVLSLDAEYHGERLSNNDFESANVFTFQKGWFLRARDMIVQSAIEYRRAIDYLTTREEIDTAGIGMIGYSMGGMMAYQLTAVDPRIKVSVACVTPILKEPYSAMAAFNFAPYITNKPFLMLIGKTDERNYSIKEAQELHDLVTSASKELVIYESGHKLPSEWTTRATKWMEKLR